jgi:hypothetical protein
LFIFPLAVDIPFSVIPHLKLYSFKFVKLNSLDI